MGAGSGPPCEARIVHQINGKKEKYKYLLGEGEFCTDIKHAKRGKGWKFRYTKWPKGRIDN